MLNLEMIKSDISELMENCVDIVKYTAAKKNLELLLNIKPGIPRYMSTDPIRLKQVITNLLSNALKFTDLGEVELEVDFGKVSDVKGKFSFSVRDTGIGISDEQKRKLFKSFSQADSSTTRKFGGTGLGLVISEMIANKLGSRIEIDSEPGKGSVFKFEILADFQYSEAPTLSKIGSLKKCLIIDDSSKNGLILRNILEQWNITSITCDNGLTALKILEESEPFDFIICDYHMPYIDGLETVRLIREKHMFTQELRPFILIHSASDEPQIIDRSNELGIRFTLLKPVKITELFNCLSQLNEPPARRTTPQFDQGITANISRPFLILIAEDVPMNLILLKAMINKAMPNVNFLEAGDGIQALNEYKRISPDLIFMDVQMPGMDGIEVTREIREHEKSNGKYVPIIALTAGALKEDEEECLEAGMTDFLTKPVTTENIKSVLDKYLL